MPEIEDETEPKAGEQNQGMIFNQKRAVLQPYVDVNKNKGIDAQGKGKFEIYIIIKSL